ncbi:hypothetical protein IJG72_01545 [bacterium]|nr:hypothetical protein [bacterium]
MGMAASQARYLSLAARKTNVEYEGQQINQARTALGNQTATLWNQQLALSVPTCPNITDYTTVQYRFNDGYNDYVISSLQSTNYTDPQTGIQYNKQVTYYYNQDIFKGVQFKNSNPQIQWIEPYWTETTNLIGKEDSLIYVDATNGYKMIDKDGNTVAATEAEVVAPDSDDYKHYLQANGIDVNSTSITLNKYSYTDASGKEHVVFMEEPAEAPTDGQKYATQTLIDSKHYMAGNSIVEQYDPSNPEQSVAVEQLRHDFPGEKISSAKDDEIFVFKKNDQVYYVTKEELDACIASGADANKSDQFQISSGIDYQMALNQYYTGTISEHVENTEYAIMDDSSGSGRYANIKLESMSETFELSSEEVSNESAYNDAMNQYYYNVTCYEKTLADINAKTSIIQEQDRTLELRLKQLETEQSALKTEMDAVKSIIKDNVDKTFKTFS